MRANMHMYIQFVFAGMFLQLKNCFHMSLVRQVSETYYRNSSHKVFYKVNTKQPLELDNVDNTNIGSCATRIDHWRLSPTVSQSN